MGHGKQSPRDKMIGMMYLVLTALLALNVSAEVLLAFELFDTSLKKSAINFENKNNAEYSKLNQQYSEIPKKYEKAKKSADIIQAKSQVLVDRIQELKQLVVTTADGPEGDVNNIGMKDDNNIPGQIMILEGRGKVLQTEIETFRSEMIGLIPLSDTASNRNTIQSILDALSTDPVKDNEGLMKTWDEVNFNHLPLAGVVAIMSKMQADVRNVESEILGYVTGASDASAFKFNKIEAIVKAPSNYIIQGNKYTAEVFIAASDTTVIPDIFLKNGSKLKVKDGKGQHSVTGTALGVKTWGGVIKLVNPTTKKESVYPFEAEYQVAAPSLVVSPVKMNVFYIGVDNPVAVSVSGVPGNKIFPSITGSGNTISRSGNEYVVKVKKQGDVFINVAAELGGERQTMGKKKFRVKTVPSPIAEVGGKSSGSIKKNLLLAQPGVKADLKNFDFDLTFKITQFTVSAIVKGYERSERSNGARFTSQQLALIKGMSGGKKIYIEGIKAKGPDGSTRQLNDIIFKLN